jgi:Glycosyl hydrolases family 31
MVLASPLLEVAVGPDPRTISFGGLDLVQAGPRRHGGDSLSASGVAMWGSKVGALLTLDQLTPELLIRWIQFAAFCPVMRTKSQGIEVPADWRP